MDNENNTTGSTNEIAEKVESGIKSAFAKLKNSKLFGISLIYFVAAIIAALALWLSFSATKEKDAREEQKNEINLQIQQMQDSALSSQVYAYDANKHEFKTADDNLKLRALRLDSKFQDKFKQSLKLESETPSSVHIYFIFALDIVYCALFVGLVIFLMTHTNIRKEFPATAVAMTPYIFGILLICLEAVRACVYFKN